MKKLEIPYNFDIKLIDFLADYNRSDDKISCIYLAPYYSDYFSAKHIFANGVDKYSKGEVLSREEYEYHISYINSVFPGKIMLLLQNNTELMSEQMVKYYSGLGINRFCVGNIDMAKKLKEINKDFYVVGSITLKISYKELVTNDSLKDAFDAFVLYFPYNRKLNLVKKLPKDFEYVLLINCPCSIYCGGTHHWFAKSLEEDLDIVSKCPIQKGKTTFATSATIDPQDLPLWDDYIGAYKLQGRGYSTDNLIRDIIKYTPRPFSYLSSISNEDKYNTSFNEDELNI